MLPFAVTDYLLATILIPLVGMVAIKKLDGRPNLRESATMLTAIALFYCVVQLLMHFLQGEEIKASLVKILPGIDIAFSVEPLGLIFALIASFLWIVTSLYSIGYMRGNKELKQTRFYICFAFALLCAMGIAFAANLFTLFIFYELMTIGTYPLVTHTGTKDAKASGRVYLGILLTTSVVAMLPAMIILWYAAGTLDFKAGGIIPVETDPMTFAVVFLLLIYGIGKAALMPMHRWLPAAMVAPTPVSALLHAVAVVKAGVFSVVKVIVYIFGVERLGEFAEFGLWTNGWLLYVAGLTVILASIVALKQDNLKLRLAYSTVSQLSYVILAAAMIAPKSILAASFHIAAHAFGKITLFFAAGSIYTASKKKFVSELSGIGRRMPWTMVAFTIGALSMIGIPPTVGFISKWFMLSAALEEGFGFVLFVLILSTVLNAWYFLPISYAAFFKKETKEPLIKNHGEAPLPIVIALVVTALGTLGLFIAPDLFLGLGQALIKGM